MDLQYFITFLICWFLQRAWIRRKYGHSWDGVRSLQFLFFTWVFFLIDLIFTFSFTFVFVFLLSSFIVLLLFINSITVILKDSFCSLYSIFYTFAMWWKFLWFDISLSVCYGIVSLFYYRAFLGPTIGGLLADKFGFDWAATGCAGLLTFSVSVPRSCILKSFA